jgi:hypothetical protein
MSGAYVRAIQDSLGGFLNLLVRLALPLAILFGLAILALAIGYYLRRDSAEESMPLLKKAMSRLAGIALVGLTFVVCWAALSQTRLITVEALQWKDEAEEVANPTEDAPAISQFGPVAAIIREQTFTRTITLPLDIGKRIEEVGVQVLSQYLPDSSSQNVLDQQDKLEQKGNGYFLTRQVKRLEEVPVGFQKSEVDAKFAPLGRRAYQLNFHGAYTFRNPTPEPAKVRFSFPLPQEGTISSVKAAVGSEAVVQSEDGNYVWEGTVGSGESRTADVAYEVVGSKVWRYDVGSRRRPVDDFQLQVQSPETVKFVRGSLQPSQAGKNPVWKLSNVVTNQGIAISFPSDQVGRETFVQTMAMLPAALAIFALGLLLVGWRFQSPIEPVKHAVAVLLFALGLGSAAVLSNYLGSIPGVIVALVAGVAAVTALLGSRSLLASLPAAVFAGAFLSPQHTGLIVLLAALATGIAYVVASTKRVG